MKNGIDHRGRFAIVYEGHRRIRWIREPDCNKYFEKLPPASQHSTAGGDLAGLLNAGSSVLGSVAHVAQAVGSLLQWWELRQERIAREIQQESDTRLRLVWDLLDRWALEHSTSEHVDLELSHYLAQEALGLLRLAGESEKVIVPQSLLYELQRVRDIVAGVRSLVVRQFLALEGSGLTEVASPVEGAGPQRINYVALSRWYGSPEDEWDRAISAKNATGFEQDLARLSRSPRDVLKQIFQLEKEEDIALLSASVSDTARIAASALAGAMAMNATRLVVSTVFPVGSVAFLIPAAVALIEKWKDEKRQENKDAVRELVLFAAEVERTRLLLRCWDLFQRVTEASRGTRLVCLEEDGNSIVAALDDAGGFAHLSASSLSKRLVAPSVRSLPSSSALLLPAEVKRQ